MATLVTFHAHPDDECIATGGIMAKAAEEGHRVVLVVATKGERGEVADGVLRDGEELWQRRVAETEDAAGILGVQRVEFLGYVDSGMMGTPENDAPESFWRADVEEAAVRLARILEEERADILTVYDDHGVYDHPDHIQVHRVGIRAGELAGTPKVYESTFNRDYFQELMVAAEAAAAEDPPPDVDPTTFGMPASVITTTVDVSKWAHVKRSAMVAHASQIDEQSFFLAMPEDRFRLVFGYEWLILRGAPPGTIETDVFEGVQ